MTAHWLLVLPVWILSLGLGARADGDDSHVLTMAPVCNRIAVPGYQKQYVEMFDLYWDVKTCAPFMLFNQDLCHCTIDYMAFTTTPRSVAARRPFPTYNLLPLFLASRKTQNITVASPTTTTTSTTPMPTTKPTTSRPLKPVLGLFEKMLRVQTFKHVPTTTPKPDRICDGCVFDRGVGYLKHKHDCNKYVMCYATEFQGHVTGEVRMCGVGKYWDQGHVTCKPTHMAHCEHERCKQDPKLDTYPYEGDCRAYWRCVGGVSMGACCPVGHAFRADLGTCVVDHSCNTTACQSEAPVTACDKIPDPDDPRRFLQEVPGHGHVTMHCAAGTIFNTDSCSCDTDIRTTRRPRTECVKELEMDFTRSLTETSGNGVHVESVNVTLEDGSACFHGNSALIIPRFSNVEVGANLNVHVRYRLNSRAGADDRPRAPQALVYNGDCGQDSSIVILTSDHRTSYGLRNNFNTNKTIALSYKKQTNTWQDATFTFHNNVMKMSENGRSSSQFFLGHIDRSRCGLKIGWGQDYKSFYGCIDKISISFCPAVQ